MEIGVWIALAGLFFAGGLTPGPAVMLVMSAAMRFGARPALVAATGVSAANLIWITLAAGGAAAVAARYPTVFLGVKLAGLAFVLWLAISIATAPSERPRAEAGLAPPRSRLFAKGVGLQLANPNALVFFGALLPAFFDPDRSLAPQVLTIMATVTATEMIGLSAYAWAAGAMRRRLADPMFARRFNVAAAVLMFSAAAFAVWSTTAPG